MKWSPAVKAVDDAVTIAVKQFRKAKDTKSISELASMLSERSAALRDGLACWPPKPRGEHR